MMMITVLGAGNMGAGIAQKYASEGCRVTLIDLHEPALQKGKERIVHTLDEAVQKGILSATKKAHILEQLSFTTQLEAAQKSQFVIEAIFEDKTAKKHLFNTLDGICAADTILATNTSSFYVTELAKATKRPDRCVGLHYFYHPAKNKLVEVIKGQLTSHATYQQAWNLQETIGKIPIASQDAPGFIVNRFFVPWLNEAMRLVEEGVSNIATVDAVAKQVFGVGMGPFELMNVTGVPIAFHAATTLAEELGPFYAPCQLIKPLVAKKSQWDLNGIVHHEHTQAITQRLLGTVFYIAHQLVFADNVCSLEDCDLGARVGLRWPQGPFQLMNQTGFMPTLEAVEKVLTPYPELSIPAQLTEHVKQATPYALKWVTTRIENRVGIITFNRPDALNALNSTVVAQLQTAFSSFAVDPKVEGIILEGRGKAFVAGADTRFFVESIRRNQFEPIYDFTAKAQALFTQIDTCHKPVVCKMNGLALGGGLELALACDYIIASSQALMGFPETGIGIYPGLGGTQRTPKRVGVEIARWLILSGELVLAPFAKQLGLVDEVAPLEHLHKLAMNLAQTGTQYKSLDKASLSPELAELTSAFKLPLQDLLSPQFQPTGKEAQKAISKLHSKAPLALQRADSLILQSVSHDIESGLRAEFEHLSGIFASRDALIGLSSIGQNKPVFTGS